MAGKGRPGPAPRLGEKAIKLSISLPIGMVEQVRTLASDDRGRPLRSGVSGVLREFTEAGLARLARQGKRQAKPQATA